MSVECERIEIPLPGGGTMAFRHLTPYGPFRMGSRGYSVWEEPVHEVRIPEGFWLGETSVTQDQFAVWTTAERIPHQNSFGGHPNHPAENLDWREANRYCAWLTSTVGVTLLPVGFRLFCLPTEAEWEYACRAGSETEYYSGDGEAALAQVGWYDGNSENTTHLVASRHERHPFGLHDLHGNIFEWCHDVWEETAYRGQTDGEVDPGWIGRQKEWADGLKGILESSRRRGLRGGSWLNTAGGCRSAYRLGNGPDARSSNFGFRVCLVRGSQTQLGKAEGAVGAGDRGRGTSPESHGPSVAGAGLKVGQQPDGILDRLKFQFSRLRQRGD